MSKSLDSQLGSAAEFSPSLHDQDLDILEGFCLLPTHADQGGTTTTSPDRKISNTETLIQTDFDKEFKGNERSTNAPRILIADDDRSWSDVVAEELISFGFKVSTALDGIIAMEQMKSFRPDVVICDIAMPRMDGLEFVYQLRDQNDGTPVILTGDVETAPEDSFLKILGVDMYLSKSEKPRRIASVIHEVYEKSINDSSDRISER